LNTNKRISPKNAKGKTHMQIWPTLPNAYAKVRQKSRSSAR
jgi:hypothetical protein